MALPNDLQALIVRYRNTNAGLRSRLVAYLRRVWPAEIRDGDIDRFVELAVPVVLAGQRTTVALTAAYLAAYEEIATGTRPDVTVDADQFTIDALRGVDAETVYRRPAITVWTALANGIPYDQAHKNGLERALDLASTDLQLAKTHSSREILGSRDVVGYRRVLEGPHTCGLCLVASTQRYRKAELMPLHPGCDCSIAPIYGGKDPGQIIEAGRLEDTDALLAERFGDTARRPAQMRSLLVTHEHGELGPLLGVRSQHFDGPSVVS